MTNFVNIRLPQGILLDPELKILVDKLAIDHPKWVFDCGREKPSTYKRTVRFAYSTSEEVQKLNTAPDNHSFIRSITVKQDAEQLGLLHVDQAYSRKHDKTWRYGVSSWRVENQRGARNTTWTIKLDMACRHVKKVFKPMDHKETYERAGEAIFSGFHETTRNLVYPIHQMRLVKSPAALQAYALAKASGEEIVSPDLLEVERQIKSDSYKQAMAEYFLAQEMQLDHLKRLSIVVATGGNHFLFRDEEELLNLDFDALPERMQSNIGIMQLVQDGELVRDVGYRHSSTHFYIYK